ncbi:hypothetical protein [Microbacterium sp. 3J1]|uniref:hypothetical protein n=1 Tax=Microbacterium sp. 3J1 TaxID=861269 RepID=UPI0011476AF8|nr:hypothetical protein [Microbacterium sp. 3J1]
MRIEAERARVLITVKATPQPSEKYGDTVCVAGVRLDGPTPTWIRLYPIAFRYLGDDAQFAKYDIIELDVRRRDGDSRRESFTPALGSWQKVGHLPPWRDRHEVLRDLEPTTTCRLMRAAERDHRAPSLGLVFPKEFRGLEFSPHQPWSDEQVRKMAARIEKESSALIPAGAVPPVLVAPRLKVRYRYVCEEPTCSSHVGRILDWELTSLQNRSRRESDTRLKQIITEKFVGMMCDSSRRTGLFLGNFELASRRSKFSVLGVYYPRRADVFRAGPTLF